jgi:hypothetical protein
MKPSKEELRQIAEDFNFELSRENEADFLSDWIDDE